MKRLWPTLAVFLTGAGAVLASPTPDEIVARAVQRMAWWESRGFESQFTFSLLKISRELESSGKIGKEEASVYRSEPVDDIPFERLVEKQWLPLSDEDRLKEDRRLSEFRKKVQSGEDPRRSENENRVAFDEELVSRYVFTNEGTRALRGRSAHVVSFRPKDGPLPVRRRIDRALNKSTGQLWIDTETHEIARVEFDLQEPIRLLWGVLGSVASVQGRIERGPAVDGHWFPLEFDFYFKGRILFSDLHRQEIVQFDDFSGIVPSPRAEPAN